MTISTLVTPRTDVRPEAAAPSAWSTELTTRDRKGLELAPALLPQGAEVFIAALPDDTPDQLVATAAQLRRCGLAPVPHIAARKLDGRAALDSLLGRLADAGIDRALVLGGDRDLPLGPYHCALQLIGSGLLQRHGLRRIFISCYPERHPRIPEAALDAARAEKLQAAADAGLDVAMLSQFCFEAAPIMRLAARMRALGQSAPLRVGLAGPAKPATLAKYALTCGVGRSLRALHARPGLARTISETPEPLLAALAEAQAARPELGLEGVHFFTFGGLARTVAWAREHLIPPS